MLVRFCGMHCNGYALANGNGITLYAGTSGGQSHSGAGSGAPTSQMTSPDTTFTVKPHQRSGSAIFMEHAKSPVNTNIYNPFGADDARAMHVRRRSSAVNVAAGAEGESGERADEGEEAAGADVTGRELKRRSSGGGRSPSLLQRQLYVLLSSFSSALLVSSIMQVAFSGWHVRIMKLSWEHTRAPFRARNCT